VGTYTPITLLVN